MPGFLPDYLYGNISLEGQTHGFLFGQTNGLSQFQIKNNYTPTSLNPCQNYVELINVNSSGYRIKHLTNSTNHQGSLTIESFINGNIPGNALITLNENGALVLSPPTTNAIQIKNNTNSIPLQFYNSTGSNYVAFQAGSLSVNTTWILPTTDSTGTQFLVSNGSGVLSWLTGANNLAKYIIQTSDSSLPNAQVLGSLSTGILKNTTTTGILSIAVAGTDYYSPGNPTFITTNATSQNVSLSTNAFNALTTGTSNAFFGVVGGQILTTGSGNHVFSANTASSLTTGGGNCLFGNSSGLVISSGNNNVLMGPGSASNLTTSSNNIFIGATSGSMVQTGSGSNVGVGSNAGAWGGAGFATYDHCVFIGPGATTTLATATNAMAIGYNASVSGSNMLSLGGTSSNAITVGINETSPTYARLCVVGGIQNVASEDSCIRAVSSSSSAHIEIQNTTLGTGRLFELRSNSSGTFDITDRSVSTTRFYIDLNGYIGINSTSSLSGRLHTIGGPQNISNEETGVCIQTTSSHTAKLELKNTNTNGLLYEIVSNNNSGSGQAYFEIVDRTNSASRIRIQGNGLMGFNNSSPAYTADVGGSIRGTKLLGNGHTPTVVGGSALGSSPVLTVIGSEISGQLGVVVGTSPGLAGGVVATFTLTNAMATANYGVMIMPSTGAIGIPLMANVISTTQFSFSVNALLVSGASYVWYYQIIGC